jgi:hypothetical protein
METEDKSILNNIAEQNEKPSESTDNSDVRKIDKDTLYRNRQINYTILRSLWFVVKGEINSTDEKRNLYDYLKMSKTRYDRICSGGLALISNELLMKIKEDMKIDEKVFSGETLLSVAYLYKGTIEEQLDKDLQQYAIMKKNLRKTREQNNNSVDKMSVKQVGIEEAKAVRRIQKDLKELFNDIVMGKKAIGLFKDMNMRKLATFLRDGEMYQGTTSELIARILELMKKIQFRNLELIDDTKLKEYVKAVTDQADWGNTIIRYREFKHKNQKE